MNRTKLFRMWINQPSTLQADHKYNGTNVLTDMQSEECYPNSVTVWLLDGPVHSMLVLRTSLSEGWI